MTEENTTSVNVVVETTTTLHSEAEQTVSPKKPNPLRTAVALLSFVVVAMSVALGYFIYPSLTNDTMDDPPTPTHVKLTRAHFTGGEDLTEQYFSTPTTLTELSTSTKYFKRFDADFTSKEAGKDNYPATQDAYAAGISHMMNGHGDVTHEIRLEVLESGAASLGEYADQYGQVGTRTIRVQVVDKSTNDRFYLIPIGLSLTSFDSDEHNQTLWPDLFYFSYLHHGQHQSKRIVTFCSTAAFTNGSAHCFLGKGQKEWEEVIKFSTAYVSNMIASAQDDERRRLHWWNSKSSASAAPVQHTKWHAPAQKVGGDEGAKLGKYEGSKIGGKVGGEIGGKIGGAVGEAAGGVVGGAVAGPVGASVGGEIGHWAGEKIGTKVGTDVGEKYGGEAGSAVGRKIGSKAGGWAGDHIGKKCDGCN
jgi:hypothetical protein